jgi:LacI family transcriptional regulator
MGGTGMAKVTLKQISEVTGYSQATVSNALNRKKDMNEETVSQILQAAKNLGYKISDTSKKINRILLVMYRKSGQILIESPLILSLIENVVEEARKNNIETLIYNLKEGEPDFDGKLENLLEEKKNGIILLATELEWKDIEIFQKLMVPFVVVDAWFREGDFTTVVMDNRSAFGKAVDYLVERGHREIGYIGSTISIRNFREREQEFKNVMHEHGLEVKEKYCISLQPTMTGAQETMRDYLETNPELPTAYVVVNDIIALGAMKALKSFGYKIPGDISIIGFDNMPFGEISSPALTTFDVRKEEIGQVATKLLLEQNAIGENLHRKVEVLTELIERDSVKDLRES